MTTTPLRRAFAGVPFSTLNQPVQAAAMPPGVMASTSALAHCLEALQREADQVQRVGRAQLAGVLALLPTDACQHPALKVNSADDMPAADMRQARILLSQALNHARELLRDPVLYQFDRIMELVDHEIDHARGIVSGMARHGAARSLSPLEEDTAASAPPEHDDDAAPAGGTLQAVCALLRSTTARAGELEQEGGIKAEAHEELRRLLGMATAQLERVAPALPSAPDKPAPARAASRRGAGGQKQAA
jgi:hypothetical protein